jgi:hypothetical protein
MREGVVAAAVTNIPGMDYGAGLWLVQPPEPQDPGVGSRTEVLHLQ